MTPDAGKHNPDVAIEATSSADAALLRRAIAVWDSKGEQAPYTQDPSSNVSGPQKSSTDHVLNRISLTEVALHNSRNSAWIVVEKKVYDCTHYLKDHPGGASSIILMAGKADCTDEFRALHSPKAWEELEKLCIGSLLDSSAQVENNAHRRLQLKERIQVTSDTRIFRFHRPRWLSLPTGKHIMLSAKINQERVMRAYTPLSDQQDTVHVDLLVKVYQKGIHPKFPMGGKMSQHLDSLVVGECIDAMGPLGDFEYTGKGVFEYQGKVRTCQHMSFVVGGTGITPVWQIIKAILRDPTDQTKVRLLYANRLPSDILLRKELDDLAAQFPDRFHRWYTVDNINEQGWEFDVGYIGQSMLQKHLYPAQKNTSVIGMCGPPPMIEKCVVPNLKALGHAAFDIYQF